MLSLFQIAILFWVSAFINVKIFHNANVERKYWQSLDHTLISEGFLTMATIFAFGRLLLLLQLNLHLGPLLVSARQKKALGLTDVERNKIKHLGTLCINKSRKI
jgi:hypothetical protein